ncbi:MAG: RecX family transcriptional regulator [Prevotellaceae bacterium]|jgi:regulatory protein|nr:RecX family transcriptional regulator [Prevotellaceae bacterium]
MSKVRKIYTSQEALAKLKNLCSRSEKCIYDIKLKLQKWGIEPSESEKIIASLLNSKFVDEERYVNAYVREKLNLAKWGKQKIVRMLKAKQVQANLIDVALNDINNGKYKEKLVELLKKKNSSIKDESEYNRKAKLLRFALSRGYEYDLVHEVLSSNLFLPDN